MKVRAGRNASTHRTSSLDHSHRQRARLTWLVQIVLFLFGKDQLSVKPVRSRLLTSMGQLGEAPYVLPSTSLAKDALKMDMTLCGGRTMHHISFDLTAGLWS